MHWLALGVLYTVAYGVFGLTLRDQPTTLSWFRAAALCIPPLTAAAVIVFRRQTWSGCQWLFSPTTAPGSLGSTSPSLLVVSELQQAVVLAAMIAATFAARRTAWHATYRRLAFGALVSFVTLTLSNVGATEGEYRTAVVYDFTW